MKILLKQADLLIMIHRIHRTMRIGKEGHGLGGVILAPSRETTLMVSVYNH
jgi:hypothetical protein